MKSNPTFKPNCSVFLLGMMGSGKTSLGKKLAKKIKYDFVDLDQYIVEKTGVNINLIFEFEGESGFRQRETEALEAMIGLKKTIIATGGGVVVTPQNRILLAKQFCIYLQSPLARIIEKTRFSKKRPLLNNLNATERRKKIGALIEQREPLYLELATHIVKPEGNGKKAIEEMGELIKLIKANRKN